jgi:hypothetical protein
MNLESNVVLGVGEESRSLSTVRNVVKYLSNYMELYIA